MDTQSGTAQRPMPSESSGNGDKSNGGEAPSAVALRGPEPAAPRTLTPRQREKTPITPDDVALPPAADHEITQLIGDYLAQRHPKLAEALAKEVGPVRDEAVRQGIDIVEKAILDGDFGSLEGLLAIPGLLGPQSLKAFLYMCYRQQFLEYIDNRESQKAFNLLQKRLKPLEHYQPVPYDFYSLAYLTSASTVHDAPGLRDWAGTSPEREKLAAMWRELTDASRINANAIAASGQESPRRPVPRDRLLTLLKQAAAWQVDKAGPRGSAPYSISTLLCDYTRPTVPSHLDRLVRGHRANVKCVDFLHDGFAVSGSSDATLRIFSYETGEFVRQLVGHQSRIWDVDASPITRSLIASGSGDGSVRIWRETGECTNVLVGDGGDVYSVRWQPGREDFVVAACYDKILRLWDVESDKLVRTFSGHSQSTLAVAWDPTGKIIASGSKDKHVRLWDAVGGVCVQTMTAHLGEITSVEFDSDGKYLLAGCKDNSIRLWDLRMQRNIYRYTGHQNTSKNIIRCCFANPECSVIASGSEDGLVYLWERDGDADGSAASTGTSVVASNHQLNPHATSSPYSAHVHPARAPTLPRGAPTHINMYSNPYSTWTPAQGTTPPGAVNVRPFKALAGHGGTVYDVRDRGGVLLSGAEDGAVGVWGDGE